ncbi:MAG: hypothetical protein Q8P67_21475 [archaeon]|nr:hypothetical protein [archaeon]
MSSENEAEKFDVIDFWLRNVITGLFSGLSRPRRRAITLYSKQKMENETENIQNEFVSKEGKKEKRERNTWLTGV